MAARKSNRRLSVVVNPSVKVRQKATIIKYAVAGALVFMVIGVSVFFYLNFANTEDAVAGSHEAETSISQIELDNLSFVDLSHLSGEEMSLLANRDFKTDTTRKEYPSVKWNMNNSMSHLTLEMSNARREYSLELFNLNGVRVLYFANLRDDKVFVDKLELIPNHQYNYVVRNSDGDIYAGILSL